jgi:hypothetical protein
VRKGEAIRTARGGAAGGARLPDGVSACKRPDKQCISCARGLIAGFQQVSRKGDGGARTARRALLCGVRSGKSILEQSFLYGKIIDYLVPLWKRKPPRRRREDEARTDPSKDNRRRNRPYVPPSSLRATPTRACIVPLARASNSS